jgi:hypothetical protein
MVMSRAGLACTPSKYQAHFLALLRHAALTNEPDSTNQMVTAIRILRGQKEKVPFSLIASLFNVSNETVQQHWKRPADAFHPYVKQKHIETRAYICSCYVDENREIITT